MPSNTGDKPTFLKLSDATHSALKKKAVLTGDTMSNIADKAIKAYLTSAIQPQPQQSNPICTFLSRFFSHV
jgi:hypothetical protein